RGSAGKGHPGDARSRVPEQLRQHVRRGLPPGPDPLQGARRGGHQGVYDDAPMEDPYEGLRGTGHGRRRLRRGLEGASMRLIGIAGLKTSGKDTTFKAIASALPNQNVQRVAFADKLKELSAIALGFTGTPEQLIAYMDEAKEQWEIGIKQIDSLSVPFHRLTGRAYLQHIGQGARKVFADGFWVDQVLPEATFDLDDWA